VSLALAFENKKPSLLHEVLGALATRGNLMRAYLLARGSRCIIVGMSDIKRLVRFTTAFITHTGIIVFRLFGVVV